MKCGRLIRMKYALAAARLILRRSKDLIGRSAAHQGLCHRNTASDLWARAQSNCLWPAKDVTAHTRPLHKTQGAGTLRYTWPTGPPAVLEQVRRRYQFVIVGFGRGETEARPGAKRSV